MSEAGQGGSGEPLVLLACALGRVGAGSAEGSGGDSGGAAPPQLLADSLSEQAVTPAKQARQHLRAILRKGTHKLQPGSAAHSTRRPACQAQAHGRSYAPLCRPADMSTLSPLRSRPLRLPSLSLSRLLALSASACPVPSRPIPSCVGKRLRLRNDEDSYDVHIVSDRLDEGSPPITLVFFVLTVPDYNKVGTLRHTAGQRMRGHTLQCANPPHA